MALGLFILSACSLLLEVLLTRIFSIYLWSHFAFMVVSLALLGFGASGTFLQIFKPTQRILRWSFALFFIFAVAVYLGISCVPFDPVRIAWDPWQFFWLSLFYLIASLPFFFSGAYIGTCFALYKDRSPRLYGINLIGSAAGTLLSLVVLNFLFLSGIRMSPYKALPQALVYPEARLLATRWSIPARIDLVKSGAVRFAPGLSLNFLAELPEQIGITLDGDRLNAVTRFEGDFSRLSFLSSLPSSAAYQLLKEPEVLVMESSGGLNLLEALYHGARHVDALESNDALVNLIDREWGNFSGNIYSHDKVRRVPQNARYYLSRTQKKYDLVILSLSDNPSAASSGLYGLNENYLYTLEAFQAYLEHLNPEGIFTVTRYLLPPPREEPRTLALAWESLKSLGIENPTNHLALLESYGTWTLLMKRSPFLEEERSKLRDFAEDHGFTWVEPLVLPAKDSLFNLSPPTDQKPFFFQFFQLSKLGESYRALGGKWEAFFEAGYLVHFTFLQALFWGCLLIGLPLLLKRRKESRTHRPPLSLFGYFFSIGLGFMFVEMAFLQKAVFLFGNPTTGFALLLAALLLFSGLGSLSLDRLRLHNQGRWIFYSIAAGIFLSLLVQDWTFFPLLAILIFLGMGLPFPMGLGWTEEGNIPIAWAVNGIASVVGAILAVIIAMEWGYSATLLAGALLYLLAGWISGPLRSSARNERPTGARI